MWGWLRRKRKSAPASAGPGRAPSGLAPNALTLVGRVDEMVISGKRQFGCLGGPLVFDTPAFTLVLDDARRVIIEPSTLAVVEGWEKLRSPPLPVQTNVAPMPTNAPQPPPGTPPPSPLPPGVMPRIDYTPLLFGGAIEIRGVVASGDDRYAVPVGFQMFVRAR